MTFAYVVAEERVLTYHEQDAQLYGTLPYFISLLLALIPFNWIAQAIWATCVYWSTGLNSAADRFFVFLTLVIVVGLVMTNFALLVGSIAPVPEMALGLAGVGFTLFLMYAIESKWGIERRRTTRSLIRMQVQRFLAVDVVDSRLVDLDALRIAIDVRLHVGNAKRVCGRDL